MLKTILVPLDGSELAERALPLAIGLVQTGTGKLILVRVAHAHGFPGVDPADGQVRAIDDAEAYLQTMALDLKGRGVAAETAVPYGSAAEALLDEIRIRRPDLVVMATHGRSGFGRWLYGSVAEAVLGRCATPILLTRAWHAEQPTSPAAGYERLIAPLDGSPFGEAALPVAAELAATLGVELVLLTAVFPPRTLSDPDSARLITTVDQDLEDLEIETRRYLAGIEHRLKDQYPSLRTMIDVRVGAKIDAIVTAGEQYSATMVVMATHGRTGLRRLFLGSVASAVLRAGETPLLLVRPTALPPVPSVLIPPAEEEHVYDAAAVTELALSAVEVELLRDALGTLSRLDTRREHVHPRIDRLLARLPTPVTPERDVTVTH